MTNVSSDVTDRGPYTPKAVYYEASDSLEYVRRDEPALYRRVDEYLTLILDLEHRNLLGFKLKGFRHLYNAYLKPKYNLIDNQFLSLINVLESAMSIEGDALFEKTERQTAYRCALEIASEDDVRVDEFPRQAAG